MAVSPHPGRVTGPMGRSVIWRLLGITVLVAALFWSLVDWRPSGPRARAARQPSPRRVSTPAKAPAVRGHPIDVERTPSRWLAAGGGPTPELNPVSLEQDLGLVREVLGEGGLVLFASGPG